MDEKEHKNLYRQLNELKQLKEENEYLKKQIRDNKTQYDSKINSLERSFQNKIESNNQHYEEQLCNLYFNNAKEKKQYEYKTEVINGVKAKEWIEFQIIAGWDIDKKFQYKNGDYRYKLCRLKNSPFQNIWSKNALCLNFLDQCAKISIEILDCFDELLIKNSYKDILVQLKESNIDFWDYYWAIKKSKIKLMKIFFSINKVHNENKTFLVKNRDKSLNYNQILEFFKNIKFIPFEDIVNSVIEKINEKDIEINESFEMSDKFNVRIKFNNTEKVFEINYQK